MPVKSHVPVRLYLPVRSHVYVSSNVYVRYHLHAVSCAMFMSGLFCLSDFKNMSGMEWSTLSYLQINMHTKSKLVDLMFDVLLGRLVTVPELFRLNTAMLKPRLAELGNIAKLYS